jgi:hypothetical protein
LSVVDLIFALDVVAVVLVVVAQAHRFVESSSNSKLCKCRHRALALALALARAAVVASCLFALTCACGVVAALFVAAVVDLLTSLERWCTTTPEMLAKCKCVLAQLACAKVE